MCQDLPAQMGAAVRWVSGAPVPVRSPRAGWQNCMEAVTGALLEVITVQRALIGTNRR